MSDKVRVLMVDDEPNVLSGYRRTIGRKLDLVTANGGKEALEIMKEQGPFPVVFTDMRMPEMDGLEFLKVAKSRYPKSVFVMLTGNADQQTAIDAINQGQIFRFLNKPCEPVVVEHTIHACKAQYDLIHAEAELLNNTLAGTVKLLIEAMVISDPAVADVVRAVRSNAQSVCTELGYKNEWRFVLAASLFLIGGITVPRSTPDQIYTEEYIGSVAQAGAKLLRHISRFDTVAQMILKQRERIKLPEDITEYDDETAVAIGSQIIRFAYDWHKATRKHSGNNSLALCSLEDQHDYDIRLINAAKKGVLTATRADAAPVTLKPVELRIRELKEGMVIGADIISQGTALITEGQHLSLLMIDRLKGFARASLIPDKVTVMIPENELTEDQKAA